ncbi:MAG: hypothetical protein ABSB76_18990 [Streptosporangiaceae bacterium]
MRRLLGSMLLGATLLAMVATSVALAVAPAAAAVVATQPTAGSIGGFGIRLVDIPVSEANNPRGLRYIIDYLHTGTTIHRRILVKNEETRIAHFTVYPDAAQISNEEFTGEAGATRSELTGWISVQHPVLNLAPGASEMDMITIKVPLEATRGEHYAEVWVQQEAYARTATGFGINEVTRIGIRVYLAVGQGGAPPTVFAITSVTGSRSAKGQPSLVVHVDNTGGRAVDLSGTAGLTGGPGGSSAGPFRSQQVVTLAPGQSGNMTFAPPKSLPDGPWRAKVTLVSGITTSVGTGTVQFGDVSATGIHLSLMAWGGLVLAGVALLGGLATFLRRRHALRARRPVLV